MDFLITLGLAITLHELGHFLVAKALGVRVVRFSIGFGPKLVGFKRGDTEYVIAPIPLGGYVKMAGDNPDEKLQGEPWEFLSVSPWKRILIVVAGPIMNLVLAFVIYYFIALFPGVQTIRSVRVAVVREGSVADEAGIEVEDVLQSLNGQEITSREGLRRLLLDSIRVQAATAGLTVIRDGQRLHLTADLSRYGPGAWIGVVTPDGPADKAGVSHGDRVVAVDGEPVANWEEMARAVSGHLTDDATPAPIPLRLKWEKDTGETVIRTVTPELIREGQNLRAIINVKPQADREFRFVDYVADFESQILGTVYWINPVVGRVMKNSPAAEEGIRPGDQIVAINGEPVSHWYDLADRIFESRTYPATADEVSAASTEIADASPGLAASDRQYRSEPVPIALTWVNAQGEHVTREIMPKVRFEPDPLTGGPLYYAYVGLGPRMDRHRMGVFGSSGFALKTVKSNCMLLLYIIPRIITRKMSSKVLGGPIRIFQLSRQQGAWGLEKLFELIAMLSANLALINLFPIPILDGGHILLYLVEGVRRKRLTLRQIEIVTRIGLAILLPLIVFILWNDISQTRLFQDLMGFFKHLWVF